MEGTAARFCDGALMRSNAQGVENSGRIFNSLCVCLMPYLYVLPNLHAKGLCGFFTGIHGGQSEKMIE